MFDHAGMDKVREQGAPLPGNDNFGYEEEFSFFNFTPEEEIIYPPLETLMLNFHSKVAQSIVTNPKTSISLSYLHCQVPRV